MSRDRVLLFAALIPLVGCGQTGSSPVAGPANEPTAAQGGETREPPTGRPEEDAAAPSPDAGDAGGPCGCAEYGQPQAVGTLGAGLPETSGLAASRAAPGVLYAHNDSGDVPRVFAVSASGAALGELEIGGASAVDWEDVAVGPCGASSSKTCIWIGDVGDNAKSRTDLALYAVDEPALDGKPFAKKTLASRKYPFRYPDGNHDCETLLVHPATGEILVVTKDGATNAKVYRFPQPLTAGVLVTLQAAGSAAGTAGKSITGGDVSPCGDRVLLRAYFGLLEYAIPPGEAAASVATTLSFVPREVPMAFELQSEAVAYRAGGLGYFTAPEGAGATLSFVGCK